MYEFACLLFYYPVIIDGNLTVLCNMCLFLRSFFYINFKTRSVLTVTSRIFMTKKQVDDILVVDRMTIHYNYTNSLTLQLHTECANMSETINNLLIN
jgi:hypothetical protein